MSEGQPEYPTPPTEQLQDEVELQDNHPSNSRALAAAAEAAGLNSDSERPSTKEALAGLMHDFEHRFDEPGSGSQDDEVVVPVNDPYEKPPKSSPVDDVDTARVEAAHEDDSRTKAVENRDVVRPVTELLEADKRLRSSPDTGPMARWRLKRERDRLDKKANQHYSRGRREVLDTETRAQFNEDFPELADDPVYKRSPNDRANYYDKQAARIGDWAGALHNHPLTAEFTEAHPGVEFEPKRLVQMEDAASRIEREIERLERTKTSDTGDAIFEAVAPLHGDATSEERQEMSHILRGDIDEVLYEELHAMEDAGEALAKRYDTFYKGLLNTIKIPDLRNQLAVTQNLLNDVRREVGLDVEGDEAEAVAQDQSHDELSTDTTPDQPQTE